VLLVETLLLGMTGCQASILPVPLLFSTHSGGIVGYLEVILGPGLPGGKLPTPGKSDNRTSGYRDPLYR
jgi:hypothetical protein